METASDATCPVCGTESFVTVLSEESPGERVLRKYCGECARRATVREEPAARRLASGLTQILIDAGIVLAVVTLAANELGISGQSGFGWRQITGLEVGLLCIVLGLLLRRALLGVSGAFLLGLSLSADLLRLGHSPGIGWRKQVALALAVALVGIGVAWQRRLKNKEQK